MTTATIAHCVPSYAKYGGGFYCYITGLATFFAKNIKEAKEWASANGCDLVRL